MITCFKKYTEFSFYRNNSFQRTGVDIEKKYYPQYPVYCLWVRRVVINTEIYDILYTKSNTKENFKRFYSWKYVECIVQF